MKGVGDCCCLLKWNYRQLLCRQIWTSRNAFLKRQAISLPPQRSLRPSQLIFYPYYHHGTFHYVFATLLYLCLCNLHKIKTYPYKGQGASLCGSNGPWLTDTEPGGADQWDPYIGVFLNGNLHHQVVIWLPA